MKSRFPLTTLMVPTLVTVVGASLLASDYELVQSTIDGGGAMHCTGGDYEISGTVGQPDAGAMTGGEYTLTAGFSGSPWRRVTGTRME